MWRLMLACLLCIPFSSQAWAEDQLLHAITKTLQSRHSQQYYMAETSAYPWRYVGMLKAKRGNGELGICTGTLITRHIVLTAAHCVQDESGGLLPNITFTPGAGGSQPLRSYRIKHNLPLITDHQSSMDNNFDVAFLVLATSPLQDHKIGWQLPINMVDMRHFAPATKPLVLVAAGYPQNTVNRRQPNERLQVTTTSFYRNAIIPGKDNQIEHGALTKQGTSGGPIFAYHQYYQQFALIGLISSQRTWDDGEQLAVGIKLNPYILKHLKHTVQRLEPDVKQQATVR